jgi:membrane-associated protease RseP (regulator of RpoE activity)
MGNQKNKNKQLPESKRKKPEYPNLLKGQNTRKIIAVLSCLLTIFGVYLAVSSQINGVLKFFASVVVLGINGAILTYLLNLEGESGLIIIKLKEGNKAIENLAHKFGKYWNTATDIGLVLGFGLSSKLAFRHISWKTFVLGLSFFVVLIIVLIYSTAITLSLIQIPLESIVSSSKASLASLVAFALLLLFGVVGFAIFGILSNAFNIVASIVAYLAGNASALAASSPGVYPVLPYFTIPLFEGLIALLVLMFVHEGSHGIAAIIAKIKVRSTGIITFGFVPVGAFVDIDEKQLDETRDIDNARVSVAGSTANMFVALLFFIPTILLMVSLPNFQQPVLTVSSVLKNISYSGMPIQVGTNISSINGIQVNTTSQYLDVIENMTANSTIVLMTDNGESTTQLISDGMPGFVVAQPFKKEFSFIRPIFATLGLITVLNLLVGIVNLMPIPSFDGHRLFKIIFKKKTVVNIIAGIIVFAFLMNIVPWIWQ